MKECVKFECHYHGSPVVIGSEFNLADMHAHAVFDDGEIRDLLSEDYVIRGERFVRNPGFNNYYLGEYMDHQYVFSVRGITLNETDCEFQILSNQADKWIDVTDAYYDRFYNKTLGKIYVNVNNLNKELVPGLYKLKLPKRSGLCSKYASMWTVIKGWNGEIKVTIDEFITKGEQENGRDKNKENKNKKEEG